MIYDTIVIGAGLSGLMAAIGRAGRGEQVLLLAQGHGATHWSSGCVDLLATAEDPSAELTALIEAHPEHPYALVGSERVAAAFTTVQTICRAADHPLTGNLNRNLWLPTALGALRPTCLAPLSMLAGERRVLGDAPLMIAGFQEFRDFFPPLIAANLCAQGYAAEGVYLDLPPLERRLDFSSMSFAALFDQPKFTEEIGRRLGRLTQAGGYRRIGLPAVLGLRRHLAVLAQLQELAQAQIFEIATLPASIAGIRLYHALEQALRQRGGRIQLGSRVLRGESDGDRLTAVVSEAAAREQRHRARRFVLATGGILGGGLRAERDGTLAETALGLPVQAPDGRAGWFASQVLAPDGHAIFRAGVAVDQQLRPVDAAGRVVYRNLAVVGSAIAGWDGVQTGCREGVALATGWSAGTAADEE
jgi:glycerol-3-phosphate dehydrogenase subunit B